MVPLLVCGGSRRGLPWRRSPKGQKTTRTKRCPMVCLAPLPHVCCLMPCAALPQCRGSLTDVQFLISVWLALVEANSVAASWRSPRRLAAPYNPPMLGKCRTVAYSGPPKTLHQRAWPTCTRPHAQAGVRWCRTKRRWRAPWAST